MKDSDFTFICGCILLGGASAASIYSAVIVAGIGVFLMSLAKKCQGRSD